MRIAGTAVLCAALAMTGCGKKKDDAATTKPGDKGKPANNQLPDKKPPEKKAVAIAAGNSVACAVMDDGGVRCWGRGDWGELGGGKQELDAATPSAVPDVAGAKQIVIGGDPGDQGDAVCATLGDGTVKCWGYGRMIPDAQGIVPPKAVSMLTGAKHIVYGGGTGYAVMDDGGVKAWNDNNVFNALGTGDANMRGVIMVPDVAGAVQVAGGQNHGCALLGDGTVKCWGYSGKKQNPTVVMNATDGVAIAASSGGGDTCLLTKAKKVICWGDDQQVREQQDLTGVTALSARYHFCALKEDGSVTCWGDNTRGQAPKNAEIGGKATQVVAGAQFSCALLDDGNVKCWGYNQAGQLGQGSLMDNKVPALVMGLKNGTLLPVKDGTDQTQQDGDKQVWDGVPPDCKQDPAFTAQYAKLAGDKLAVKSAYARVEGEGKTIALTIANFQADPKKAWEKLRGKQLQLGLRFAKIDLAGDRKPQKVEAGVYSMDTKQDKLVYVTAKTRQNDVTLGDLSLEGVKAGTVELKHLDDKWICGHVAVQTKDAKFEGDFAAAVVGQ